MERTNTHYKHTRYVRRGIKQIPGIPSRPVYKNHTYTYNHESFNLKYAKAPDLVIKKLLPTYLYVKM